MTSPTHTSGDLPQAVHADARLDDARNDLSGEAAIKKIRDVVGKVETCFFVTQGAVRPMGVREVDERGNLYFLSDKHSHKNAEIGGGGRVELYFQASQHSGFMHLVGQATVSFDKDLIERLWSPMLKVWFTEGKDDPCISVIEVKPTEGQYWDNKHGEAIAGIKMMIGAVLGKQIDDAELGTLRP